MQKFFIHGATYRNPSDPQYSAQDVHSAFTIECETKESPLWWQEKGMSYTATGYGSRIPTRYMVKFNGKWRRVYCRQYSNNGTLYIGKLSEYGERLIVRDCA